MKKQKQKITRSMFVSAMEQYGDDEGYSYDGFSTGMTWLGFKSNRKRGDGRTEREVWLPLLKPYFKKYKKHEKDFVEI